MTCTGNKEQEAGDEPGSKSATATEAEEAASGETGSEGFIFLDERYKAGWPDGVTGLQ